MKFNWEGTCESCGCTVLLSAYGDGPWQDTSCPACHCPVGLMDPLSVSVTTERLLLRSKAEVNGGDYSLAIVIGAIAVESFLTRLFLKLKGMTHYATTFNLPSPVQEEDWEKEYPRSGGFTGPADFVSKNITGMPFDDFVRKNNLAMAIMARFPAAQVSAKQYFQDELFKLRNRIVHWGYVNSTEVEALRCHDLAVSIVSILREMDKIKYGA